MTPAAYKRVEMMCSNLKRTKGSRKEVYDRYSREIGEGGSGLFIYPQAKQNAKAMLNAYAWAELGFGWDDMDGMLAGIPTLEEFDKSREQR